MKNIYDDHYRVAPPYEAPGESEPEWIPYEEAMYEVFHALRTNKGVYGKDFVNLVEYLMDCMMVDEDATVEDLLSMWDSPEMQLACEDLANFGDY